MLQKIVLLQWRRFNKLTEARDFYKKEPCIYIQTNQAEKILRIGKASKGLEPRYRGGTGYALDAAMDGSGNLVFVTLAPADLTSQIEANLIHLYKPPYNNIGKVKLLAKKLQIDHSGDFPEELNKN